MLNQPIEKTLNISNISVFIQVLSYEEKLTEICENKSLLNVLNKPLLTYQLEFLERNNIKEVTIITNKTFSKNIEELLVSYEGELQINTLTTNNKGINILNFIKKEIKHNNFILMSAEALLYFDLFKLLDSHIDNRALITLVLNNYNYNTQKLNFLKKKEINVYGIEDNDSSNLKRVVFTTNRESDDSYKNLNIPKKVFRHSYNYGFDLLSCEDVHFYIFNKNIYQILESSKYINNSKKFKDNTINNDLIPYLIQKAYSEIFNTILINSSKNNIGLVNRVNIRCKLINLNEGEFVYSIRDYQRLISVLDEIRKPYEEIPLVFFQTRNNTKNYFMNFAQQIQNNIDNKKNFNDHINEISSISLDSYIADPIIAIEKGSRINRTIGGQNLTVQEKSKIMSCLIYDNVNIGKDCNITNCIIGENAKIGNNCVLSDCVISSNYFVSDKTNKSGKIISKDTEDNFDF